MGGIISLGIPSILTKIFLSVVKHTQHTLNV